MDLFRGPEPGFIFSQVRKEMFVVSCGVEHFGEGWKNQYLLWPRLAWTSSHRAVILALPSGARRSALRGN